MDLNEFKLSSEQSPPFLFCETDDKKREFFFTFNNEHFPFSDSTTENIDDLIFYPIRIDSVVRDTNPSSSVTVNENTYSTTCENQESSKFWNKARLKADLFFNSHDLEAFSDTFSIGNVSSTTPCFPESVDDSKKKNYNCSICETPFCEPHAYLLHYEQVHKLFRCPLCDKCFKQKYLLKSHILVHSDRRDFACSECSKTFRRKNELRIHLQKAHKGKTKENEFVFCDNCPYKTRNKQFLRSHVRLHLGISSYTCEVCGIQCQDRRKLLKHKEIHNDLKLVFACNICGRHFTRKQTLIEHKNTQHEDGDVFQCDICGRTYSYITSLKYHMKIHRQENQVECDICKKILSSQRALINHKKIHKGLKDCVCNLCGKMYYNNSSLHDHLLMHTGNKPFQCRYCDKSFANRKILLNHEKIHSSNRIVHNCPHCEKSYFTKFKLKTHVMKKHNLNLQSNCKSVFVS